MVMRCQTSVPLPGAKPVIAPSRGYSNHQFTGGYDFMYRAEDLEQNNSESFAIHKEFTNLLLTVWKMPATIGLALDELEC